MTSNSCKLTDAVLAQFLDGELIRSSDVPPIAELAGHLGECPVCQDALARGRRLDALLASDSRLDTDQETVDRLMKLVDAETEAPTLSAPAATTWTFRALLVAAGFLAALLLQVFQGTDDAPPATNDTANASESVTPHVATPSPSPRTTQRFTPSPRRTWAPRPRVATRMASTAAAVRELERLASAQGLARDLAPMTALRAYTLGQPMALDFQETARAVADAMRLDAVGILARSRHGNALPALAAVLTREPADGLLPAMLQRARGVEDFDRRLAKALDREDEQLMKFAAMLGGERLDQALRNAVGADPEGAERVAHAAAMVAHRPGRVRLLMSLWSDLQSRGLEAAAGGAEHLSPAEARADRWFGQLPATATLELISEARRTNNAGQRRRCLLALAARGDSSAADFLVEVADGPRFEESLLAAHALGRCPANEVAGQLRFELRRSRRPELLLAALASARFGSVNQWVSALDASEEEKAFLLAGGFHYSQFKVAAKLFRDGHHEFAY